MRKDHFTDEALALVAALVELKYSEDPEDQLAYAEAYDFARCQRPDGSFYGIPDGKLCKKGKKAAPADPYADIKSRTGRKPSSRTTRGRVQVTRPADAKRKERKSKRSVTDLMSKIRQVAEERARREPGLSEKIERNKKRVSDMLDQIREAKASNASKSKLRELRARLQARQKDLIDMRKAEKTGRDWTDIALERQRKRMAGKK